MTKREYLETMVEHHQQILRKVMESGNADLAKQVKSQLDYYLKELYSLEKDEVREAAKNKLTKVFKDLGWKEELLEASLDYVLDSLEDFDMSLEQVIEMWVTNTKDNYSEEYEK